MSREATSGKVSVLGTKLGLEEGEKAAAAADAELEQKKRARVLVFALASAAAAAVILLRILRPRTYYVVKEGDTLSKVRYYVLGSSSICFADLHVFVFVGAGGAAGEGNEPQVPGPEEQDRQPGFDLRQAKNRAVSAHADHNPLQE